MAFILKAVRTIESLTFPNGRLIEDQSEVKELSN
jgi:hypothetical protein